MELTRKEFILLTALAEAKGTMSQRELAASGGMSIGSVNRLLRDLSERGYVKAGRLTPEGLAALEPYRVKRAVFLAAGIEEIYIVRGCLAEEFDRLLYKYPMIHFIENPSATNPIIFPLCFAPAAICKTHMHWRGICCSVIRA